MAEIWGAIAVAAVGAGTAIYSADQNRKNAHSAIDAQKQLASDIKYTPINIEQLKADATAAAIENATNSLAIERQLQPNVAATRDELSRQINEDLKLGGALPADVQNRVTSAGRTIGARSGVGAGGTTPLTASLLGLSSIDLLNKRRADASNLLAENPLQPAGLDPGQVAGVEIANNDALNNFNLQNAGVQGKLIDSEAAARSAQLGGQLGTASSLANLLGTGIGAYNNSKSGIGDKTNYDDFIKKKYGSSMPAPAYTPVQESGFFT